MNSANASTSFNLAPDISLILLQDDNFLRYRPLGFPLSVLQYTTKTPLPLPSISESEGRSSEIHSKQTKICDYIETFASSLVEQNEVESSTCIAVSSNEKYRETTDVKNPDPPEVSGPTRSRHELVYNDCGKELPRKSKSEQQSVVHSKKLFVCHICQKSVTQKWNFDRHMLFHKGIKSHKCGECGKAFILEHHPKEHMRNHTGEKPFACDTCGKTFKQENELESNVLIHEGEKTFFCEICGKAFRRNYCLKRHVLIHKGEKPFVCEICGKAFIQNNNFKRHVLIHKGEKPFFCDICGKAFRRNYNLKKHVLIHKRDKPYK